MTDFWFVSSFVPAGLILAAVAIRLGAAFKNRRNRNGHRKADTQDRGGAAGDAGAAPNYASFAPIGTRGTIPTVNRPGQGAGNGAGVMAALPPGCRAEYDVTLDEYTIISPTGSVMGHIPAMQFAQIVAGPKAIARSLTATQVRAAMRVGIQQGVTAAPGVSFVFSAAPDDAASAVPAPQRCPSCGAAHRGEHECPVPSDLDLAVVRGIQRLAAEGKTPDEIAAELGLTVGWRYWFGDKRGLTSIGVGDHTVWPVGRPLLAVCADDQCCGSRGRCHCWPGYETRPRCRIHAKKTVAMLAAELGTSANMPPSVVCGAVALWSAEGEADLHEGETGYLATRAYPLGLPNEFLARAYGVPVVEV